MKKLIAALFPLCLLAPAHAENWVFVGTLLDSRYGNADVFVDSDSAVRTGDLATIVHSDTKFKGRNKTTFDCNRNVVIDKDGQYSSASDWISSDKTHVVPASLTQNMQRHACANRLDRALDQWRGLWK